MIYLHLKGLKNKAHVPAHSDWSKHKTDVEYPPTTKTGLQPTDRSGDHQQYTLNHPVNVISSK